MGPAPGLGQFKDSATELRAFRLRILCAGVVVLACFSALLGRFLWLQVAEHAHYAAQADSNRIALLPIAPLRGAILDRHGKVLVRNERKFVLELTPSKIDGTLDQVMDRLSGIIEITPRDRRRLRAQMAESRSFAPVPLKTKLSDEEIARFAANSYQFPGVEVQARFERDYPYGELTAHALGYVGRISQKDADAIDEAGDSANYKGTDYIGKSGVEKTYEAQLHGTTGIKQVEVTASGREVRTLASQAPVAGKNLVLSLDMDLQQALEKSFGDRRGAAVAIEPSTGEVLAYVSKPSYDPNLFVDGIDQENWDELNTSIDRPLLNRPISGLYAPGSTFKPYMALAALELGIRTPGQTFNDPGYLMVGAHKFRDDGYHGVVNLRRSLVVSSNTYYYRIGTELPIDTIHDFVQQFGFGAPTGIDLPNESEGVLPSTEWKRHRFKNPQAGKWYVGDTVSVSNGSGYNSYTPIQIATAIASLANNGNLVRPHLVREIVDPRSGAIDMLQPVARHIKLHQHNIDLVKDALVGVTTDPEGTASKVFAGLDFVAAGKTGTAQVVNVPTGQKYNAAAIAERHRDNGLFIAFAPAQQPRIAIAVVVENGGWGTSSAAPIARDALNFYLHEPVDATPGSAPSVLSQGQQQAPGAHS